MAWILTVVFLAVEALALASAVHALFTVRTAQGTIAWVIGLIAFPWLGLPLYWFFGSRRFDAHSKVMKQALVTHQAKIHELRAEMEPFQVPRPEVSAEAGRGSRRGGRRALSPRKPARSADRWPGYLRRDSGRVCQCEAVYFCAILHHAGRRPWASSAGSPGQPAPRTESRSAFFSTAWGVPP